MNQSLFFRILEQGNYFKASMAWNTIQLFSDVEPNTEEQIRYVIDNRPELTSLFLCRADISEELKDELLDNEDWKVRKIIIMYHDVSEKQLVRSLKNPKNILFFSTIFAKIRSLKR